MIDLIELNLLIDKYKSLAKNSLSSIGHKLATDVYEDLERLKDKIKKG